MKLNRKIYTSFQLSSAVFMIMALLWLTVSLPFVYDNQQKQSERDKIENASSSAENNEDSSNPFGNTTEEKNPNSSNSLSEEYLHDHYSHDHFFPVASQSYKCINVDTYIAYHGELDVPPPDVA
jgi:hypothetical protein